MLSHLPVLNPVRYFQVDSKSFNTLDHHEELVKGSDFPHNYS